MKLSEHPTVKAYRENSFSNAEQEKIADASIVKEVAINAGAADAGIIEIERGVVAEYREDILDSMPGTKAILVLAISNRVESLEEFQSCYYR